MLIGCTIVNAPALEAKYSKVSRWRAADALVRCIGPIAYKHIYMSFMFPITDGKINSLTTLEFISLVIGDASIHNGHIFITASVHNWANTVRLLHDREMKEFLKDTLKVHGFNDLL